ncbi:MAG TPA: PDZ domain-containing protein, partial [Candidatus Aminicenantes bacterium]|nr:PDZ domain-containing protein [Candidatus Aminicenantes bacterium]
PYDVIVEINGQPVQNGNDLRFKIADIEPGSKVKVKIVRDGQEMTLVPTVEEMEPREEKGTEASADKNIGLTVVPLTPSLARRYSLKTTEGLLITEVRESSEAERKGIAAGDIILEVNRNKVLTVKDLERILKKTDSGEDVMLLVRREGEGRAQEIIITLRVP